MLFMVRMDVHVPHHLSAAEFESQKAQLLARQQTQPPA